MVIIVYRAVQTGANIQSGGVKKDLFKEEYQGSFDDIVAKRPTKDAEKVTATKKAKDTNLFLSIKVLYMKIS